MTRCFIALELSEEVRRELQLVQQQLPEADMKLVEPENLHLTLQFLGELTDEQIHECRTALSGISLPRFEAHLGSPGVFPSESYVKVAWISLEPEHILLNMHARIHSVLKDIAPLDSKFASHITIARIKYLHDKAAFLNSMQNIKCNPSAFIADTFVLKKSTLTPEGPHYESIEEFPLQ